MKNELRATLILLGVCICAASAADSTFTFKGFSLGMSLDDAEKLIKEKYSDAFGEIVSAEMPEAALFAVSKSPKYMIAMKSFPGMQIIEADSQKEVTAFMFHTDLVNKLFNSADMTARAFAEQFLHSYHLPQLKAATFSIFPGARPAEGWEYTSPDGFRVRITVDKEVIIQTVPSSKDRAFD